MICPEDFQDRLTQIGGTNQYGEPMFRVAWGKHETFRAGGVWPHLGFKGYRDLPLGHNDPCWMILMWQGPELYGTPGQYYAENRDELTGLQTLGEYPYSGRYKLIQKLMHKEVVNGVLKLDPMPLSDLILTVLVPIIKAWQGISAAEKRAAHIAAAEREERERSNRIEDSRAAFRLMRGRDESPLIQKKIDMINRYWNRNIAAIRRMGEGFRQQA